MEEEEPPITVEDVLLSTEQEERAALASSAAAAAAALQHKHVDEEEEAPVVMGLSLETKTWDEIGMDVTELNSGETQGTEAQFDFEILDVMEAAEVEHEAASAEEEVVELSVDIFDAPNVPKGEGLKAADMSSSTWSIMEQDGKQTAKDAELFLDELELAEPAIIMGSSGQADDADDLVDGLSSRKRKASGSESPVDAPSDPLTAATFEGAGVDSTKHEEEEKVMAGSSAEEFVLLESEEDDTLEVPRSDAKPLQSQPMEVVDLGGDSDQSEGENGNERSVKKLKTSDFQTANIFLAEQDIVAESVGTRKRKSSESRDSDPAIKTSRVQLEKSDSGSLDTAGKLVDTSPGAANQEVGKDSTGHLASKRRKKRRESITLSQDTLEQVTSKGMRSLRHQVRVSTYDESLADATIEEHIGTLPSRAQRRRKKLALSEKAFDAEAAIASAIGFPRESLTEEEVEAGVVLTVGSQEQVNYILVRNHILTKWRENVCAYIEQDTIMESIRAQHKGLVATAYKFLLTHGYINFGVAPAFKAARPQETSKASVIVIGAGLAGLGAARQLIAFGHKVVVLEGRQRPGGRVYTKRMEGDNLMASADLGGSVITGIEGNPLGVLARQLNIPLHKIREKCPLYQPNGLPVKEDVDSKVETQFNKLLDSASKWREDVEQAADSISLGVTLETLREIEEVGGTPEERQLYDWHLANLEYANAGLLTKLSLAFWDQDDPYEMGGDHCFLPGGNVKIIQALAEDIPVLYGKTVHTIKYGPEGVKVWVGEECYDADMALCTVPLGVLQRGMVKFEPELPQRKQDAVKRLGFGLLNKVVMLFPEVFWGSELDMFGHLAENPSKRGEFFLFYSYGAVAEGPLLLALVAGEAAIEFEQTPPLQAVTRVMNVLRGIYEPRGIQVPNPVQTVCTRWGSDYLCYGSYSNVAVGASGDDYDILAESLGDGRLFFAGEATIRRYPATMHGAYMSGLREAGNIAAATAARQSAPKGEQRIPKDMHFYSSTLVELFKEPDLEFGSISIIFDHQTNDPKSIVLVRLLCGGPKRNKSAGSITTESGKIGDALAPEQQLHLYTTITRQQAFELREVRGGDSGRFAYLCQKLGVKLVGRRGLGPQGDALVVAIKWHRATRKSAEVMRPPKPYKAAATSVGASPK